MRKIMEFLALNGQPVPIDMDRSFRNLTHYLSPKILNSSMLNSLQRKGRVTFRSCCVTSHTHLIACLAQLDMWEITGETNYQRLIRCEEKVTNNVHIIHFASTYIGNKEKLFCCVLLPAKPIIIRKSLVQCYFVGSFLT